MIYSLLSSGLFLTSLASPSTNEEKPKSTGCGFPCEVVKDKEIKNYIGKVGTWNLFRKINTLLQQKYPDSYTIVEFEPIETVEITNGSEINGTFLKIRITSIEICGVKAPSQITSKEVEPLSGPYTFSGSLSSGRAKAHGNHYCLDNTLFEIHTSWNPTSSCMRIGIINRDTGYLR